MHADLKDGLCEAFCQDISVRDVPAGFAVSTVFDGPRGDPIGFYIVGPDETNKYRIQDDGRTIPFLEAAGVDFSVETRRNSFNELLAEYGSQYDEDSAELFTDPATANQLPTVAMRFVALLLRIQDFLLMTQERVATTFREDVLERLRNAVGANASIAEREAVSPELESYEADIVLRAEGRDPVAVFLATYDSKIHEAVMLTLITRYEAKIPCRVVALLESQASVTAKMRQRADNRLDAVPVFRGDEIAAIAQIQRLATGLSTRTEH